MTTAKQYPKVSIPGTQLRTLASSFIDQEYNLFISLPPDYSSSEDSYPVLYALDANVVFGMVTDIVRGLNLGQELPEMIIVGIAYPVEYYPETVPLRERDYLPTNIADVGETSGGAAQFLKFIQAELFPFIASNYRIKEKDNTLFGYSFGGLFAMYSLFHQPNLFQRYVLASPAVGWDDKVMFTFEAQYAQRNESLPARVFYSFGSLENEEFITDLQKLAKEISNREYKGLDFTTHSFADETHLSVVPASISKGLMTVFT